jgi:hypothetical protein
MMKCHGGGVDRQFQLLRSPNMRILPFFAPFLNLERQVQLENRFERLGR